MTRTFWPVICVHVKEANAIEKMIASDGEINKKIKLCDELLVKYLIADRNKTVTFDCARVFR